MLRGRQDMNGISSLLRRHLSWPKSIPEKGTLSVKAQSRRIGNVSILYQCSSTVGDTTLKKHLEI